MVREPASADDPDCAAMTVDDPMPPVLGPAEARQQLDRLGAVALPGTTSAATHRWLAGRRTLGRVCGGIGVVGGICAVVGVAAREVGAWSLLLPLGLFLVFFGVVTVGLAVLSRRLIGDRLRAEHRPVVLDETGISLRGIGPIPWRDVEPPEIRRIWVRHDIGGRCALMELTPPGHRRVNSPPGPWTAMVGPRPYLRVDVPYLLLPGIDGFSEDETVELFRVAHQRFSR